LLTKRGDTKIQSSQWHTTESPPPKKARISKSKMKSIIPVFYCKGAVHKTFVRLGQTVTEFYVEVLKRLKKRATRVRPEIANTWVLHHENSPNHTSLLVSVSGETNRGIAATTTLKPRPGHTRFLSVSPAQFQVERKPF